MNDLNQDLMIPVERIVRSVIASSTHKMRMREELYAHLEQIYLEEIEKESEQSIALEIAIQRLGNEKDLQDELQSTISRREKFGSRYNSLFTRKRGESRVRFAVKMGLSFGLLQAIFYALAIFVSCVIFKNGNIMDIAPLLTVVSLLMGWNTYLGINLAQPFFELESYQVKGNKSLSSSGFYFGISVSISEVLMWLSIPSEFEGLNIAILQVLFPFFVGWGMFCLVVRLVKLERDQTAPWELLQLGD